MFCTKCGSVLESHAKFCPQCGTMQNQFYQQQPGQNASNVFSNGVQTGYGRQKAPYVTPHQTPRCTCCGYVGNWSVAPVLRTIDYIIGVALLFLGILPGFVYIGVVAAVRSNPNNREKICPQCKAQNLWTFIDNRYT